jgi:rare lipoprotein A
VKGRVQKLLPAALLSMPLFLAACGGQPARQIERAEAPVEASKTPVRPARQNVTLKRGGGYYKDDGPAEDTPDNLDDIPDAEPRAEPLHRFANRPYVVLGKSYVPNTTLKPHQQRGIASWYGKKFHGQKTSIGEPYDMFSMTAAHPTLAIPSYVRVTSANNGKSVVVRVTDRGPFHADRVIDLSYAAAYKLGFINNGSGPVEVEAILPGEATTLTYAQVKPPDRPAVKPAVLRSEGDEIEVLAQKLAAEETPHVVSAPKLPAASVAQPALPRGIFLQLGAFASADNAESLRSHLSRELDWLNEGIQINANGGIHRVHLGPYTSRADAEKIAEKIRLALGYKPTFVTR